MGDNKVTSRLLEDSRTVEGWGPATVSEEVLPQPDSVLTVGQTIGLLGPRLTVPLYLF